MVYLDNAATTFPKPGEVYVAMDKVNREEAVNAGRGSYKLAQKASKMIFDTKGLIRGLVGADSNAAVVFSPSITVAINQIVHGLQLREKAVIYVSPFEHNAVARSIHQLSMEKALIVKELPINENLEIDLERMKYEFSKNKPEVVICIHVSNVTGYVLPVKEIFEEAKKHGSVTILDSAQSLGLIQCKAGELNADIIAFAGHKTLYGPFGIGGFINVNAVPLDAFICGGTGSNSLDLNMPDGNEAKYESSSQNIVAVAGLNAAIKCLDINKNYEHEKTLTDYLVRKLSEIKDVHLYVPVKSDCHVGIVSFSVNGFSSEDIGTILDEDYDIAVRTGYHCAPYIHKYLKDENSFGTIRVGLGQFSSTNDIDKLINALEEIIYE